MFRVFEALHAYYLLENRGFALDLVPLDSCVTMSNYALKLRRADVFIDCY